jgi:hypothetical protein
MSLSIEGRISKLLGEDKVCMGRVSTATVRQLALEFARDPEPDGDVLAERAACLAVMQACHDRMDAQFDGVGDGRAALEARRLGEAMESIRLGLHRSASKEHGNGAEI